MGGVLIGVEADADFAKDIDYLTTVRGRLGIPAGPFLVYGTAGGAWEGAHEHFDVDSASGGLSRFSRSISPSGWTAGGGVETFVMPAVSVGVEGLYYDLGSDTHALTTPASAGGEDFAVKDDRNFAVVRARLTYHFGF
jgi:outer membrane immunogenic protein